MRFVMFYHSLVSDWNHGNAHFLRGVASDLVARGHEVTVFEPADGWSRTNLLAEVGPGALEAFARRYPTLSSQLYDPGSLDLDRALAGADIVLVHEWNDPALVAALGERRRTDDFLLLFHDTHHRAITAPDQMSRFELGGYDAVLAFGHSLANVYLRRGWCRRVFTWHEAADARVFGPAREPLEKEGDLIWIGNWGDDERTAELEEMLLRPVRALGLKAKVYGVRYPDAARQALARAGIEYGGFLPNFQVPEAFARYRVTVHVPRRPYTDALPGIPTIRPFEAMACGIPLVSAPWDDREGLFRLGRDYLQARNADEMQAQLDWVLSNPEEARALAEDGRRTVLGRHTCAHRTDELLSIVASLRAESASKVA